MPKNNDLEQIERTDEHGRSIDLQTYGQLSDTRSDFAGNEVNREIRNDEINYLKNSRRSLYSALMITGKLTEHLEETDRTAKEQIQTIVEKMAKTEGITEVMKVKDPQSWTGLMNNLLHSAEEIVLPGVVFS